MTKKNRSIGRIIKTSTLIITGILSLTSCKDVAKNYVFEIEKNNQTIQMADYNRYGATEQKFEIDGKEYFLRISDKSGLFENSWDTPSCEYISLYNEEGKKIAQSPRFEGGNLEDLIIKNIDDEDNKVEFWASQRKSPNENDYFLHKGELYIE
jgi:hypothetical protein